MEDWRYSEEKLKVRHEAIWALMSKFGGQMEGPTPKYSSQSIYECAQDWVSQGNMHVIGIEEYFRKYYAKTY